MSEFSEKTINELNNINDNIKINLTEQLSPLGGGAIWCNTNDIFTVTATNW